METARAFHQMTKDEPKTVEESVEESDRREESLKE